jgi:hypothetical protein
MTPDGNAELAGALADVSEGFLRIVRAATHLVEQFQERAALHAMAIARAERFTPIDTIVPPKRIRHDAFPGCMSAALAELTMRALHARDMETLRCIVLHFPEVARGHGLEP